MHRPATSSLLKGASRVAEGTVSSAASRLRSGLAPAQLSRGHHPHEAIQPLGQSRGQDVRGRPGWTVATYRPPCHGPDLGGSGSVPGPVPIVRGEPAAAPG